MRLGALDRFFRSRTQLAAIAVLGLCVLLAVGVQVYSSLSLSRVLSENWRGAYDLLVTADGDALATCKAATEELVAPNFIGFGSNEGISLEQWGAVRRIAGVDVAAPIGAVGQLSSYAPTVYVYAPIEDSLGPQGFSVTATVTIDDGIRSSVLASNQYLIQVDPTQSSLMARSITSATEWSPDEHTVTLPLVALPSIPVTVVAVDPDSERRLLGSAGDFLAPLQASRELVGATAADAGAKLHDLVSKGLLGDHPEWVAPISVNPPESSVMPIVINSDVAQSVNLTLRAEGFKPIPDATNLDLARMVAATQPVLALVGEETKDMAAALPPFTAEGLNFPVPGLPSFPPPIQVRSLDIVPGLKPSLATPVRYAMESDSESQSCHLSAMPQGDIQSTLGTAVDLRNYHEQTYRSLSNLPVPKVTVAPLPVGSYSVSDVDMGRARASYVPLGAYESGETQILGQVDDPETSPSQGVLRPGISGLGITTGSAGALTTLEAAKLIRGDTPIDAIRVRVAGVDRYDDAGRVKVAKVAEAIRALGLHVDVVAGSSREAVSIYVPDYTPTEAGGWEDLGWVRQQWSALDAAAKVESSLDVGGLALLVYAVVGGALLAGAASVLAGIARRRAVRTLRQIGWTGRQALVWVGGEYLVGAAVLVAVSAAALGFAWWAGTLSPILGTVVGVVVAGYCAGGLLSALLAMRDPQAPRRRGVHKDVHPVATAAAFGVKTAARTHGVTVTTALTLALIGAGIGVASGAILGAITGAGATLLAGVAVSSLLPLHLALALVGVCSGLVLAVVGRRADRPRRARALDALTGMGWERRTVNVSLAAELAITLVLALILAPVAVAAVSLLADYPLIVTVPLTVAGTVLAAGVILTTRTARA